MSSESFCCWLAAETLRAARVEALLAISCCSKRICSAAFLSETFSSSTICPCFVSSLCSVIRMPFCSANWELRRTNSWFFSSNCCCNWFISSFPKRPSNNPIQITYSKSQPETGLSIKCSTLHSRPDIRLYRNARAWESAHSLSF